MKKDYKTPVMKVVEIHTETIMNIATSNVDTLRDDKVITEPDAVQSKLSEGYWDETE